MTSLFPHPPYAEDQPYARTILYLHVVRASAMSFTFVSLFRLPVLLIAARYRKPTIEYNALFDSKALLARTLRTSGRGLVLGAIAGVGMTWGRMMGREEIEWKDRSWRVLENEGEVKTDWVTLAGAGAGAAAGLVAARSGRIPGSVGNAVLGGAAVGTASGIPYMIASFATGRKPA